MSYRAFIDEIKKGLPSKNYLLAASDPFLLGEAIFFIKRLVPEEESDFNFHRFDLLNPNGGDLSFEGIIDVLNTVPFFSGTKIVIIENFQKLPKKELKKLERYLASPAESAVMVLLYLGTVKKDIRESLRGVKQIPIDIPEREIPAWLKAKARARNIELSDQAVNYLIAMIGPEPGLLSSEIEKCALLGKSGIDKEDLVEIIEGKRTYSVFTLIDAIKSGDTEKVFKIYGILKETEEPYSLLGALNWQYSRSVGGAKTPAGNKYAYNVFKVLNEADEEIKSSGGIFPVELLLVKLLRLSKRN